MPITTAAVVMGGAQLLKGTYETIKAGSERKKAMRRYNENPYQIPQSQVQAVSKAATLAQGSKLAGQDVMEANIASRTGEGIGAVKRAAQSPSQVLASTIDLYKQQQAAEQNLNLTSAQDYRTRQQGYIGALTSLSPFEQKKWEYSTLYPSQAGLNYASGLSGAGQQDITSGASGIAGAFANKAYLDKLGTSPATPSVTAPQTQQQTPFNYWGGGVPDLSIQQRQGNYF